MIHNGHMSFSDIKEKKMHGRAIAKTIAYLGTQVVTKSTYLLISYTKWPMPAHFWFALETGYVVQVLVPTDCNDYFIPHCLSTFPLHCPILTTFSRPFGSGVAFQLYLCKLWLCMQLCRENSSTRIRSDFSISCILVYQKFSASCQQRNYVCDCSSTRLPVGWICDWLNLCGQKFMELEPGEGGARGGGGTILYSRDVKIK